MNRMKTLALVLALALIGLSLLSRFTNSRPAAEHIVANHSAEQTDNHEKVKDGEPIDLAVKQEIRKEFTLKPGAVVYVYGINGKLDVTINGLVAGKPWTATLPSGAQPLQFKQYRRIEGVLDLPPQAVLKTVTAKVVEGTTTRSAQTFKL